MSGFTRFIGGSPFEVLIKLLVLSFVVGVVLSALNIDPLDVINGFINLIERIYNLGWGALEWALRYLLLGAAIVVPIWFIMRLLSLTGRR